MTLVPTGPLTNIALLLARHPEAEARIERVVLMGGAIGEGNATPAAEFNIWADPEAARRVFSSSLQITMVGLDVTHRALITAAHVDRLAAAGAAGRLAADLFGFYGQHHLRHYGWAGAPVHDAVAVAHVIDDGILETRRCGVRVDTGPELSRGRTYVDLLGRRRLGAHLRGRRGHRLRALPRAARRTHQPARLATGAARHGAATACRRLGRTGAGVRRERSAPGGWWADPPGAGAAVSARSRTRPSGSRPC